MRKFTKIVENMDSKKYFKVNVEIDLLIPADNKGEAAYKADAIIAGINNLSEYVINKVDEPELASDSLANNYSTKL